MLERYIFTALNHCFSSCSGGIGLHNFVRTLYCGTVALTDQSKLGEKLQTALETFLHRVC